MERKNAERLIKGLEKHAAAYFGDIPIIQKEIIHAAFLETLLNANADNSSGFYTTIPRNQQFIAGQELGNMPEIYHSISLNMILRNTIAGENSLSKLQKFHYDLISILGYEYGSPLIRNLLAERSLTDIMVASPNPFSLLAEFKTYDHDNEDDDLYIISIPVLVIPDAQFEGALKEWTNKNTLYEKEVGLFFRHAKRIAKKDYTNTN